MIAITTRTVGNCAVLDCSGKLTVGPGVTTLRDAVRAAVKGGHSRIVLNLKEVEYSDSCGIGELLSSMTHVQSHGGQLVLLNLTRYTEHLLMITKLLPVFEVHNEEGSALAGCR
jgi:anti-sigma B factor antagonist